MAGQRERRQRGLGEQSAGSGEMRMLVESNPGLGEYLTEYALTFVPVGAPLL